MTPSYYRGKHRVKVRPDASFLASEHTGETVDPVVQAGRHRVQLGVVDVHRGEVIGVQLASQSLLDAADTEHPLLLAIVHLQPKLSVDEVVLLHLGGVFAAPQAEPALPAALARVRLASHQKTSKFSPSRLRQVGPMPYA